MEGLEFISLLDEFEILNTYFARFDDDDFDDDDFDDDDFDDDDF